MSFNRRLFTVALVVVALLGATGFDAVPSRAIDITGHWKLNAALSDDVVHMLEERQRKEYERYMQWRRQQESRLPARCAAADRRRCAQHAARAELSAPRVDEAAKRRICTRCSRSPTRSPSARTGSTFDFVSAVESRRVVAGSRTQVSLPEGHLADSKVGWDGQWFVIERIVRGGPRVVEKFRLVPKTGQLEYQMEWSGDSEIAGMKVRRVFDRVTVSAAAGRSGGGPSAS